MTIQRRGELRFDRHFTEFYFHRENNSISGAESVGPRCTQYGDGCEFTQPNFHYIGSLVRHDVVHEAVRVPEQAAADGDLGAELPVELLHRPRLLEGDPVEAVDDDVVAVHEPLVGAHALNKGCMFLLQTPSSERCILTRSLESDSVN